MATAARTALRATAAAKGLFRQQKRFFGVPTPEDKVRSSTSGMRATVFGAYGFVGRYVTALIAGGGTQVMVPFRGDDMEWRHLKVMGDLGGVVPVPFNARDEDSIRRAMEGSDVVINLIGKDYETKHYLPWLINSSFQEVHVDIPQKLARIALEQGVTNFVHLSSLSADEHSMSQWSQTKALGEQALRAEAPGATIVRAADVFGPEDRFLNLFAKMYGFFPRLPLVEGGTARVQPLFVGDLAKAISKIAMSQDPSVMLAQTYELAGPEDYTYREVVEYVFETIRAPRPEVVNISSAVADAVGLAIQQLPNPLITKDRFRRMQEDSVLDELSRSKRLHHLGIEATSMEMPGFSFLHRYRGGSSFLDIHEAKNQKNTA